MLKNLKQIRISKGLSLRQLSNMTNISKTYLNDLENLNRNNPSYIKMRILTDKLEVSEKQLEG